MQKILRVNMTDGSIRVEPVPEAYRVLGGRALTSRIVCDEVEPTCDPMGPRNKLIWAPGLLSGTILSSSSRVSVGCKSPLTGGIKEANGGGELGLYMAQAGYRAFIIEGAAKPGHWHLLSIGQDGAAQLEAAPPETVGAGTAAIASTLYAKYGRKVAQAICGPAGEQLMLIAGITNTDRDGRASRLNARGGVGAVMGSKGLKAIVIAGDKRHTPAVHDPVLWKESASQYVKALREHPSTASFFPKLGTPAMLEKVNALGGLPTRNFRAGQFEQADDISGAQMRAVILERGGKGMTTHACMTGCAIQCSNVFPDADGNEIVSSMEYETHGLMGSNLGIGDLDAIAHFTRICNDLGCDTIEVGGALGVLMEAGTVAWGDIQGICKILDEDIRHGTPLGRIAGQGAAITGKVMGIRRVPVVKNQTISAYDPRAIKGNGVTYCSTPMGADHTTGNTIAAQTDHLDPEGKVELSRVLQIRTTVLDMLGFCAFARGVYELAPASFVQMLNARLGTEWQWEELSQLAVTVMKAEIEFNRSAGLGVQTDRLPEWMLEEALPPHNARFDVPYEAIDRLWTD